MEGRETARQSNPVRQSETRWERPGRETLAALREAERIARDPSVKGYHDLEELFRDLNA